MILKFHHVKEKLPETYSVMGMKISFSVPVLLKDETRVYATMWEGVWRDSFRGGIIPNVVEWGEVVG